MSLRFTIEDAITAWRRASRIAFFTSGRISLQENSVNVTSVASQKNLGKEESTKFQTFYTLQKNSLEVLSRSNPVDSSNEQLKAFDTNSNLMAVLREVPDNNKSKSPASSSKNRQILEVWKNGYLHSSLDLGSLEKHGKVYTDVTFGCFELSPDEKHLVYVAEKKEPKKQSYLQYGIASTPEGAKVGAEYEYKEEWGEQLVGKSQPVICLFKVDWEPFQNEEPVRILELDDEWSPGQLSWVDSTHLTGLAWYNRQPRRLGIIYCTNRPGRLFKLDITSGSYDWYGPEKGAAVISPRCSSQGSILYLQCQAFGPHHKEQKIMLIHPNGKNSQQIDPSPFKDPSIYQGMYNDTLPSRCWSPDGKAVVFSTPCRSNFHSYVLNLSSSEIHRLPPPDGCAGTVVLDVLDDLILVVGLSLTRPDQLYIGRIDWTKLAVEWKRLSSHNELPVEHSLTSRLLVFDTPDDMKYEALLVHRKDATAVDVKTPLIVYPHGGPHCVYSDQFSSEVYFFTQLGFAMLLVNFRGSAGYGEEALHSLLGKVGVQDVQEVHQAALKTLEDHSYLDKDRVFLYGGSHGGFLVTHLSGQYPDFYRAVSSINGVVNLATMFTITDIADWPVVEAKFGDGSELEKILDAKMLSNLYECSPIKYVDRVTAPTLLLVGKVDLRVPPTQSIEYYRALQLHGRAKVKMLLYDDCHPLGELPHDTDVVINTALWFRDSVNPV